MRRQHNWWNNLLCVSLFLAFPCLSPIPLRAQTADSSPQKIQLTVSTAPGGSLDLYTRLVGQHIGRFLSGNPTVVITNMPGAGGMTSINWLYSVAPRDGTVFGIVPPSGVFSSFFGDGKSQVDARRFGWVGSLDRYDGSAVVWGETPFRTAQDLLDHEIVIGGGGVGSDMYIWPNLLRGLIGAKIKLVNGYVGTTGVALAMERGEVQGMIGQDWDGLKASKPAWIREAKIRLLMQIAPQRRNDLSDIPTVIEYARSPEDKALLELFIGRQEYGHTFTAPPELPPVALASLRRAFSTMVKDPAFLADAEKIGADLAPATGEEITALAERIYASPPEIVARARAEYKRANGE